MLIPLLLSADAGLAAEHDSIGPNRRDSDMFGIAAHAWWLDPNVHGDQLFAAIDDLDVETVRIGIDWKRFEPEPGEFDWDMYDRVFGELARRDILVIANFNTIPDWASEDTKRCGVPEQEIYHCQLREDMYPALERAMHAAVSRYPWIEHWEYWNEPEMWTFMDEQSYLEQLSLFFDVVKEVNPGAQVAASTLVGPEFIESLYNISEDTFGDGNEPWDAIAYHPYNEEGAGSADEGDPIRYDRILELRDLIVERSGRDMKLWITEYGWYGEPSSQARNLVAALDWMRRQPFIEFAHLHMLHDWHPVDARENYGLMAIVPDGYGRQMLTPEAEFAPKAGFYDAFKYRPRHRVSWWPRVPLEEVDSQRVAPNGSQRE